MDPVPIIPIVLGNIQYLVTLGNANERIGEEIKDELRSIKSELELINFQGDTEESSDLPLQLQELVYQVEDFIYDLWIPGKCGSFILQAIGMDRRPGNITLIKRLKEDIKSLKAEWDKNKEGKGGSAAATPGPSSSAGSPPSYAPEASLVGIDRPKREILGLLLPEPADGQLRVISIVGCSGVGKTALARALYGAIAVQSTPAPEVHEANVVQSTPAREGHSANTFHCKAWVVASTCNDADDLLNKILKEVDPMAAGGRSASESLRLFLSDKRYLVFIDDMRKTGVLWDDIKDAFPKEDKGSRIVVTTSVRPVADVCSSGSFLSEGCSGIYVYTMQCLGKDDSEKLFWTKAGRQKPAPALILASKGIIDKCDGLPLALISAADCLRKTGPRLDKDGCTGVENALGNFLTKPDKERAFAEMKRALVQCYDSLPDNDHRSCLLYVSIFPRGHQIKIKSLVRRLIAERFFAAEVRARINKESLVGDVRRCLKMLIGQSMLEPVLVGYNTKVVKRCQVHSIMLEFIIQKSLSKNFVTLVHKQERRQNTRCGFVRRLTVQSSTEEGRSGHSEEIEPSTVRSLTIFKSELSRATQVDFKSCKVLRLLDLEGCKGLTKKVIDGICQLLFLLYLSLRNTDVQEIPTEIEKLKHLETLDIRETPVTRLPMEVIMLPQLAYLFGKFELPLLPAKETKKLTKFLKKKSKLHTLAGFVINETNGFETIIRHARMLKKVKVCKYTLAPNRAPEDMRYLKRKFKCLGVDAEPSPLADSLASSLRERYGDLESLSVDVNGLCKDSLGSLEVPCTISSIKLRGELESLPLPATLSKLTNLSKLHLFSTGLSSQALAVLQYLECLEYLKLYEDRDGCWDGRFDVQVEGFPSLHWLCFEAPKLPKVEFHGGSMGSLNSLHLLCPGFSAETAVSPLGVKGISHLEKINEVILHHSADDARLQAWKDVARMHISRPYVIKQSVPNSST